MWLNTMTIQTCGTFQSCLARILDYFLLTNLFYCFLDINMMFYDVVLFFKDSWFLILASKLNTWEVF